MKHVSSLFLYHYYEASIGPFRNLSDLHQEEAERILRHLRQEGKTFAAQRKAEYLTTRNQLEQPEILFPRCVFRMESRIEGRCTH